MPCLRLSLLGSFHATFDKASTLTFRSAKTRALLAYLAVESDRPHTREYLSSLLWPDEPEPVARRNLRQTLYYLSSTLDVEPDTSFLICTPHAIQFNSHSEHRIDVAEFLKALEEKDLEAAAALYRGDFLAGLSVKDSITFEEWVLVTQEWLHRLAVDALHQLTERYLEEKRYAEAQTYAGRQLALEPWREEAQRQLMRALVLHGQRSAALAQYERCCRQMAEEMGIAPDGETTALYEQIRDGELRAATTEKKLATSVHSHHLPPQATPFVGRQQEISAIQARLNDPHCRLLTLTGVGGVGKTRLATQVASALSHANDSRFADGIYFVPLAGIGAVAGLDITPPDTKVEEVDQAIVAAIADALSLTSSRNVVLKDQLLDYLNGKRLLLILDNLEHLCEYNVCIGDILRRASGVTLLVTSQIPLNLHEEYIYPLEGLEVPPEKPETDVAAYSSVRLFIQQARRIQPHFALANENQEAIAGICRYVVGLPLGIELAASWLRGMTCQEIAAAIGNLDFLVTPLHNVPGRHRSMRAVFEYSWRLLDPQEQRVLARLAVFRGKFHLEAAQNVTGASLLSITSLVVKSLLARTPSGHYYLHPLLRQFAREKLSAQCDLEQQTQTQHSFYYLTFLQARKEAVEGKTTSVEIHQCAIADIDNEIDNVREAWQWTNSQLTSQEQTSARCIWQALQCTYLFCNYKSWYAEGEFIAGQVVALLNRIKAPALWMGQVKAVQAVCAASAVQREKAKTLLTQSAALLDEQTEPGERAFALLLLGITAYRLQIYLVASEYLEACLRSCQVEDWWVQANAYYYLGFIDNKRGAFASAWPKLQASLAFQRQLNNPSDLAAILSLLGYVGAYLHKPQAVDYLYESLDIQRATNNKRGIAQALDYLGTAMAHRGEYTQAETCYRQGLIPARETGDPSMIAECLVNLCFILIGRAMYQEVLTLSTEGIVVAGGAQDKTSLFLGIQGYAEVHLGLETALAQPHLSAALDMARAISFPLAMVLPLCGLGEVARQQGRYEMAWDLYREALATAQKMRAMFFVIGTLVWMSRLHIDRGYPVEACEWLYVILRHPLTPPAQREFAAQILQDLASLLPSQAVEAVPAQDDAGKLDRIVNALLLDASL